VSESVICYYPGGGGNRLHNKLLGKGYSCPGRIYDYRLATDEQFKYLYKDSNFDNEHSNIILTHCMDITLIRKLFPARKVIQINSNYKKSLMRQWKLMTRADKQESFENDLDNAFTFIKWHNQYYKEYMPQGLADEIVDVENGTDDFAIIMQTELKLEDKIFELAWQYYDQYGNNAPVITLYKDYINGKK
jgi:hypothetical protein